MAWELEREERVGARVRRALRSVEESEGGPGPLPLDPSLLARAGTGWADEQEEVPLRGRLRRALLAID